MDLNDLNQAPAPAPKKPVSYGGLFGILLILALVVVGAFYVWGERIAEQGGLTPEEQETLNELQSQNDSTDPAAIESDLNAQTADDFDQDFDQAYAEMDAAFEAE